MEAIFHGGARAIQGTKKRTFNPFVVGSIPAHPTNIYAGSRAIWNPFSFSLGEVLVKCVLNLAKILQCFMHYFIVSFSKSFMADFYAVTTAYYFLR
jgi:hypothetical protein